ncbi:hypothetical protein QQZ08_000453 [Neonectria magnoliae]|uniref:Protein kinase domain-containing protein n=1 Tax=Neonectria magnoliae TaxID=2732573 RepID=A0ABR1IJ64_9HYPO
MGLTFLENEFGPLIDRNLVHWDENGAPTGLYLTESANINPATHKDCLAKLKVIPTEEDSPLKAGDVRTLKVAVEETIGDVFNIAYRCPGPVVTLHYLLTNVEKPPSAERRELARIITENVRSMHIRHQVVHGALQTESFLFLEKGNGKYDDPPYTTGWMCPPSRIHAPPMGDPPYYDYDPDNPGWWDDVWSLMMILSEIAEWKPLDGTGKEGRVLFMSQVRRKQLVQSDDWKGKSAAAIFEHGFGFIDQPREVLKTYSFDAVNRFFDTLCDLLLPGSPMEIDAPPESAPSVPQPKRRVSFNNAVAESDGNVGVLKPSSGPPSPVDGQGAK